MRATPLSQVKSQFGNRQGLVDAILPLLGSQDEDTKSRLMGTSNKKLLRIFETANIVKDRFGSRKNLVQEILTLRYPNRAPDDGFLKKVEEATLKNLLELHRQVG